MNRPVNKSDLGYLGSDFQYKLVKCFMEEPEYFPSIYSVVEQNAFTESLLKRFVGTLKDYYSTTGIVPSYETIAVMLKQKARMENEIEEWDELIRNLKELSTEGTDVIEDSATRFFKQQNMIKVANEILKKTQDGDTEHYEECLKMMEEAIHVGSEDDMGFNPYDVIDEVMRPNSDIPIATGIDYIDEALNGGLYKGHIGLVLGPSGFGKTTFSTAVGSYASTNKCEQNDYKGWKTLQFCFEDDVKAISKKHFSRISQIEAKDLTKRDIVDDARYVLDSYEDKEMFRDNLVIKKYKTGTKTIEDLKVYIKKLINKGFRPDLIILDYFECLKLIRRDRNETKWDLQENAMRQLEVLAEEFNVALWIMTQGNKESFAAEVVRMDQAGGSITKVQIGHVIVSIARTLEQIDGNRATIAILKNRQGACKRWEVMFNNGTSTITCELVEEFDTEMGYEEEMKRREESFKNKIGKNLTTAQNYYHEHDEMPPETPNIEVVPKPAPEPEKPVEKVPEPAPAEPAMEPQFQDSGDVMFGNPEDYMEPVNKGPVNPKKVGDLVLEVSKPQPVKEEPVDNRPYYVEEVNEDLMVHFDELESEVF